MSKLETILKKIKKGATSIDLHGKIIILRDAKKLYAALSLKENHVKHLDLSDCNLTNKGVNLLLAALKSEHCRLKGLRLSGNPQIQPNKRAEIDNIIRKQRLERTFIQATQQNQLMAPLFEKQSQTETKKRQQSSPPADEVRGLGLGTPEDNPPAPSSSKKQKIT